MNKLRPSTDLYPSAQELLEGRDIPQDIAALIVLRYDKGGRKYATRHLHPDGRRLNACMFRDSLMDALDELVDALFNFLVLDLKRPGAGQQYIEALVDMIEEVLHEGGFDRAIARLRG